MQSRGRKWTSVAPTLIMSVRPVLSETGRGQLSKSNEDPGQMFLLQRLTPLKQR